MKITKELLAYILDINPESIIAFHRMPNKMVYEVRCVQGVVFEVSDLQIHNEVT